MRKALGLVALAALMMAGSAAGIVTARGDASPQGSNATIRIKVIIKNHTHNSGAFLAAQKKRPAFAFVPATPMQLSGKVEPEQAGDFNFSSHGNHRNAEFLW